MTIAMLNLGPCAMLPPHYHLRATNMVVAIVSILINLSGCGNATLVSALNSEDSGTHNILNGLVALPANIVRAVFGNPTSAA
jgi:hypothetical protein